MKKRGRVISCCRGEVQMVETGLRRGDGGKLEQMGRGSVSTAFKAEYLWMEAFEEGARLAWLVETITELNLG